MGRVLFGGLTDAHTKVAGKMESNMERGCTARETKNGLASGIRAREKSGSESVDKQMN